VSFTLCERCEFLVRFGDFQQRFALRGIDLLIGSSTCLVSTLTPMRGKFLDRCWRPHDGASPHHPNTPSVDVVFAKASLPDYLSVLRNSARSASRR
jgi:hypothetical protein